MGLYFAFAFFFVLMAGHKKQRLLSFKLQVVSETVYSFSPLSAPPVCKLMMWDITFVWLQLLCSLAC